MASLRPLRGSEGSCPLPRGHRWPGDADAQTSSRPAPEPPGPTLLPVGLPVASRAPRPGTPLFPGPGVPRSPTISLLRGTVPSSMQCAQTTRPNSGRIALHQLKVHRRAGSRRPGPPQPQGAGLVWKAQMAEEAEARLAPTGWVPGWAPPPTPCPLARGRGSQRLPVCGGAPAPAPAPRVPEPRGRRCGWRQGQSSLLSAGASGCQHDHHGAPMDRKGQAPRPWVR